MSAFPQAFPLIAGTRRAALQWSKPENCRPSDTFGPGETFGMPAGPRNSFWCLDLDTKNGKDGIAALDAYMRERGVSLPDTRTTRTPSGGVHYFWLWENERPVRFRIGILPGVDVPVAVFAGEGYRVVRDVAPVPAPQWLVDFVGTRAATSETDGGGAAVAISPENIEWEYRLDQADEFIGKEAPAIAGQGEAQKQIWRMSLRIMRTLELPVDTALERLAGWNSRCVPPWAETELRRTLINAAEKGQGPTGLPSNTAGGLFAPAMPALADDAPPGSWRRKADAAHVRTFRSAVEVHGGAPKETSPTAKELAAVFMGASAQADWRGVFQWDEFRERLIAVDPPMRLDAETRGLSRLDLGEINLWLACRMGWKVAAERIEPAILAAANAARFHSVCEYLDALPAMAVDAARAYFGGIAGRLWGAEDDAAESGMFLRQCVAAVRRVRRPGTKVDKMLILHGPQGFKKSLFLARIFGEFFTDELPGDWTNRDAPHALRGKWGVEIAELAAWPKNEEEVKKAFLTRQEDVYREYGTGNEIRRSRQCTFWGSTNADAFLRDATGSRRYDVLHVARMIDLDAFDRDALWAAASALESAGEPHYLATETGAAEDRRAEHAVTDPWDDEVAKYLRKLSDKYVSAEEALTSGVLRPVADQTPADLKRVQNILRRLCGESKPRKTADRKRTVRMYPVPDLGAEVRTRVALTGEFFTPGETIGPLGFDQGYAAVQGHAAE